MHRIWKALRDRRGFTLIEIAIVIAIIGILLLIALPLFTGARTRAYTAEARQISSEWKALVWSCLVQNNFKETKCDTSGKVGWTAPADSDAWQWSAAVFRCATGLPTVANMDAAAATCADNNQVWIGLKVPDVAGVGLAGDYYLIIYISNGRSYESPGTGVDIVTT